MNLRLAACLMLLLLQSIAVHAEPRLRLDSTEVNLTDFPIGYYIDPTGTQSYRQARTQPYLETSNTTTLGTNARTTWFKVTLDNGSGRSLALNMHLPHAYHVQSIQIYQERDGALVDRTQLDLEDANESPLMYRGTVVYPFDLPADTSTTLYVRSEVYSHQWFALNILNQQHSRRALIGVSNDIALLVGMMLALVFYNGLLYFASSKKENIYYSLYLISGMVWIALSYGLVASLFDVYGPAVFMLNLSLISMPIFLILFMTSIFQTKQHYPLEHLCLQAILVPLSALFLWGVFDLKAALKPSSDLAAIVMLVTFSVSISLWRKGNPLARFFLVGHSFFIGFNILAVLFYKGMITPNYIISHAIGIGIVLEGIMLAFIISYRIKVLENIRASQDELKRQAATDPLTRLYNRRHFSVEADILLEQSKASRQPLAILAVDIDHFKKVNDAWGHHIGDQVIVKLAQTFKTQCRTRDLVARFGGEEFVMLLPDTDQSRAIACAERIRQAVEIQPVPTSADQQLNVTVSIGVTCVANDGTDSIETALERADKALYQAKDNGRNRVWLYQPGA